MDKGQQQQVPYRYRSRSSISFEDINVATGSTHFMSVTFFFFVCRFLLWHFLPVGLLVLFLFLFFSFLFGAGRYPSRRKTWTWEGQRKEERRTDMEKRDATIGEFRPASSDMERERERDWCITVQAPASRYIYRKEEEKKKRLISNRRNDGRERWSATLLDSTYNGIHYIFLLRVSAVSYTVESARDRLVTISYIHAVWIYSIAPASVPLREEPKVTAWPPVPPKLRYYAWTMKKRK